MARPATPSNNSQVYTGVSRMFMAAACAASIKTDLVERLYARFLHGQDGETFLFLR